MERFFTSSCPWNKMNRARILGKLSRVFCFLFFSFFFYGCSDENFDSQHGDEPYIPFPPKQEEGLVKAERNKVDLQYFASIPKGDYLMGSPENEQGRSNNERQHKVRISKPYYISKFEITVLEWNQVFGELLGKKLQFFVPNRVVDLCQWFANQTKKGFFKERFNDLVEKNDSLKSFAKKVSKYSIQSNEKLVLNTDELKEFLDVLSKIKPENIKIGNLSSREVLERISNLESILNENLNLPVTDVSYYQALQYCHRKTSDAHEKGTLPKGLIYRLPTEAEWEYACRAESEGICGLEDGNNLSGVNANINGGARENVLGKQGVFLNRRKLTPVTPEDPKFSPNAWGIYDMHGNVMEWCYDFYDEYPFGPVVDPIGPIRGTKRVLRGGSFLRAAQSARSAARMSLEPSWRGSEIGFRVVLGYPLR